MKKMIGLMALFFLLMPLVTIAEVNDTALQEAVNKLGVKNVEIQPSPIAGIKVVLTDNGLFYISNDGHYLFEGNLYDLQGKEIKNITNQLLVKQLDQLKRDMIIYPAKNEKYIVNVFTDFSCGYCKKFHNELKNYNDLGITIRYLGFARFGENSDNWLQMKAIWCSENRNLAFDQAIKNNKMDTIKNCDIDLNKQHVLSGRFGISGTPSIILQDGSVLPGYFPAEHLINLLAKKFSTH